MLDVKKPAIKRNRKENILKNVILDQNWYEINLDKNVIKNKCQIFENVSTVTVKKC